MAKAISQRQPQTLPFDRDIPMIKVDDTPYWSPPKGLDLTNRLSRVARENAVDLINLVLDDGVMASRLGTSEFGGSSTEVMAIVGFVAPDNTGQFIRITTTGLERWDGAAWDVVAAGVFTGGRSDYFSVTGWGDEILMTNGVDKIFSYNPQTGVAEFIDESYPAKHIQTFGGRVIASAVLDGGFKAFRVRWSVKNNNRDWTGDGSGFEDLFSSPGGRVDAVHGCFPVTDDTAMLIRETTTWQMSLTGNVLLPFRFSLVFPEIGTRYRRAITAVPGGYALITRDNVMIVSAGQVVRIGDLIRESLIDSITDDDVVTAVFDFRREEIRFANEFNVWRYAFRDKGWSKDRYPQPIRFMTYVRLDNIGIQIDELAGTIDGLLGSIDEQVSESDIEGFFFVGHNMATTVIMQEDPDATQDVTIAGTFNTDQTDNFSGVNGVELGDRISGDFTWALEFLNSGVTDPVQIQSNKAEQVVNGVVARYSPGVLFSGTDYGVSCKASEFVTLATNYIELGLRVNLATGAGYYMRVVGSLTAPSVSIFERTGWAAGEATLDSNGWVGDTTDEHTYRFECVGSTLNAYVDDVLVATAVDITYAAAGSPILGFGPRNTLNRRWAVNEFTVSSTEDTENVIVAATSLLAAGSPYQRTKVIEAQMEYESGGAQTLIFEYSIDKGATWTQYSTQDIAATSGPTIMAVRQTLTHHNLQVRVRSATLGQLSVISFVLRIVAEAKVHP